jgi:hypothetical protein
MSPTRKLSSVGRASALLLLLATLHLRAQEQTIQINWQTRSAGCPTKLTSPSQSVKLHLTDVNDMVIDFTTGERLAYVVKYRSTPASVAPPENPWTAQSGQQQQCPVNATQLADQLKEARTVKDSRVTPDVGTPESQISLSTTLDAIKSHKEFADLIVEYQNDACKQLFDTASDRLVAEWIGRYSGDHALDQTVVLNQDQNYHFYIEERWKNKPVQNGKMDWKCGDTDIWTLSIGPLVTTLPYRTYNAVKEPVATGSTTQTVLSVSGNSNVNVLGAALLNLNLPNPTSWDWTGLALTAGPVYAFSSAPSVSKLGLFTGVSIQLYKSFFITPGVHIGEFADYPAGFVPGSVIPPDFGTLTPVTRNTIKFAIGITYKTSTFKKSSNQGTGANTKSDTTNQKNQTIQNTPTQNPVTPNTGQNPTP